MARTQVVIASPLEAELAAKVQAADPRAEVLYEPDLLPPARYPGDHRGDATTSRHAVVADVIASAFTRQIVAQ